MGRSGGDKERIPFLDLVGFLPYPDFILSGQNVLLVLNVGVEVPRDPPSGSHRELPEFEVLRAVVPVDEPRYLRFDGLVDRPRRNLAFGLYHHELRDGGRAWLFTCFPGLRSRRG